jgi:hypothetical protein
MATAHSSQPGGQLGSIRLYHGTDLASAEEIRDHGLDAAAARAFGGGGEFWATTDRATADLFAQANPAGGPPARLDFVVTAHVLRALLSANPPLVYQHGDDTYEFCPGSYPTLNQAMANRQVVSPVP